MRLFEVTDPHVRLLMLHDKRTKNLCSAAGDKYIAVQTDNEVAFAKAVRELGYVLAKS